MSGDMRGEKEWMSLVSSEGSTFCQCVADVVFRGKDPLLQSRCAVMMTAIQDSREVSYKLLVCRLISVSVALMHQQEVEFT